MQNTIIKTDHTLRELYTLENNRFPFGYYLEDISIFENQSVSSHWHPEFELGTVKNGTIEFHIGTKVFFLHEGESIFINAGIIHSMTATEHAIFENIVFPGSMIASEGSAIYDNYVSSYVQSDIAYLVMDHEKEWHTNASNLLRTIYQFAQNNIYSNCLSIHIQICSLWKIIYDNINEAVTGKQTGISSRIQIRLRTMLLFIKNNFGEKLSLADIENSANISKSEATRCFQIGIGNSPLSYTNEYRLQQAKVLLLTSTLSISEIALKCGFDNCSYFDRQFKLFYGLTPVSMRKTKSDLVCD